MARRGDTPKLAPRPGGAPALAIAPLEIGMDSEPAPETDIGDGQQGDFQTESARKTEGG